jgi:hypothetical protein
MGVEFVEISEEDRVVLESFLDTLDES